MSAQEPDQHSNATNGDDGAEDDEPTQAAGALLLLFLTVEPRFAATYVSLVKQRT